jgi:hypothetical protein
MRGDDPSGNLKSIWILGSWIAETGWTTGIIANLYEIPNREAFQGSHQK